MATEARNLELVTYLDKTIDEVARCAAREAAGEHPSAISSEEDGVVLGDAVRLRQIVNDLASNACRFTPAGGRITCSTRLVFPAHSHPEPRRVPRPKAELEDAIEEVLVTPRNEVNEVGPASHCSGSADQQAVDNPTLQCKKIIEWLYALKSVTRAVEYHPTRLQGKLFTAFHQTEQGRQQGGKGTGLGVGSCTAYRGGRLGVRSKLGHGSTFWVELPSRHRLSRELQNSAWCGCQGRRSARPRVRVEKHSSDLEGPLSIELLQNRSPRRASVHNAMESLMDQGTHYTRQLLYCELPRNPPQAPVQGTAVPSLKSGSSAVFEPPIIVLVVDDDWLTQTIMSRTLSRLGCHVSTAENGKIALEMIIGRTFRRTQGRDDWMLPEQDDASTPCRYDVVFLDNQMPIMSGLEVIVKLREMGRGEFVVGVTGKVVAPRMGGVVLRWCRECTYWGPEGVHRGRGGPVSLVHGCIHTLMSILTKPVFEPNLVHMLAIADERRRREG
ncbi:hypothetical protein JVT61DRAFT_344 [Boletus reticuloceps]|uniref:Response regulatory domain-containing protein n=1 Tax=Boletus reticuloceps TaxID=495285 RepID=A0A8I2YYI8_9AGAM|nr:hypothetical protein JVT61DRAFT_344 [Boletus reticuloceps]